MRVYLPLAGSVILLAALISSGGQTRTSHRDRAAPGRASIVYGGELLGYLSPCGCAKPMLGGMSRRGAVVGRLRRTSPVLAVENGDLVASTGRQDEIKAETLVDMLSAIGYAAIAVGERDARLGVRFLSSLRERANGLLICGNLLDRTGRHLLPAMRVVNSSAGRTRTTPIAAVLSPSLVPGSEPLPDGLTLSDPTAALKQIANRLKGGVLLFHGPKTEASAAARAVPGLALVVYAHGADTPAAPIRSGRALVVSSGARGKYLGVAGREPDGAVISRPAIALRETVGDDESIARMYRDYQERVAAEDLLALMPRYPMPEGAGYAGSAACSSCHPDAAAVWSRSRHASAMATLVRTHSDRDPECVPCHATAPTRSGGYRDSNSRSLAHVGCESCHGPSAEHAHQPARTNRPKRDLSACAECHVPEHSPGFRFETYWPKIKH